MSLALCIFLGLVTVGCLTALGAGAYLDCVRRQRRRRLEARHAALHSLRATHARERHPIGGSYRNCEDLR